MTVLTLFQMPKTTLRESSTLVKVERVQIAMIVLEFYVFVMLARTKFLFNNLSLELDMLGGSNFKESTGSIGNYVEN